MTPDELKELLKQVKYPGFSRDIVSFGLVRAAAVIDGTARVSLQLTTADASLPQALKAGITQVLRGQPADEFADRDSLVARARAHFEAPVDPLEAQQRGKREGTP